MDCPVCLSEIPLDDVVFIEPCGHAFCRACVRAAGAAAAGAGVSTVRCPESECEATVSPAALASLLDQRTVLQLERNSVPAALGAALSWCRTPDCSNCVEHEGVPAEFFCTACGHRRCVLCGAEPYHHGRSCAEASAPGAPEPALAPAPIPGAVIPATEPGMAEYLATHTRVCRRCQQAVEKASGCSKMMCRCGYRFCFDCGTENSQCPCTPRYHGYINPVTGHGDFSGLESAVSTT